MPNISFENLTDSTLSWEVLAEAQAALVESTTYQGTTSNWVWMDELMEGNIEAADKPFDWFANFFTSKKREPEWVQLELELP